MSNVHEQKPPEPEPEVTCRKSLAEEPKPAGSGPEFVFAPGGFGFVMNIKRLVGAPSFPLPDGHELRRATPDEVIRINQTLHGLMGLDPMHQFMWEYDSDAQGQVRRLPEGEHRHFVISFPNTNSEMSDFQSALDVCRAELEIGPVLFFHGGFQWQSSRLLHVIQELRTDNPSRFEIAADDIAEITSLYEHLKQSDAQVRRAAKELGDLKWLPSHSNLRVLGYFAVLESLLTHPPKH